MDNGSHESVAITIVVIVIRMLLVAVAVAVAVDCFYFITVNIGYMVLDIERPIAYDFIGCGRRLLFYYFALVLCCRFEFVRRTNKSKLLKIWRREFPGFHGKDI